MIPILAIVWSMGFCTTLPGGHDFANTYSWPAQRWCGESGFYIKPQALCIRTINNVCGPGGIDHSSDGNIYCHCKPVKRAKGMDVYTK